MNKAEWDALDPRERDEVVALTVMGWHKSILQNISAQLCSPGSDEATVDMAPSYTTDRNACALVLDEIERWGIKRVGEVSISYRTLFINKLVDTVIPNLGERTYIGRNWDVLRADPDTICYCALRAVEDG